MGFNFPNSPTPGQVFTPSGGYSYVFLDGVWRVVQDAQSILTADTRNRIVNGAMQISQELGFDVGGAFINNSYVADQWQLAVNGTTALPRAACVTSEPDSNYIRANSFTTVDAAVAAADLVYFYSRLEGINIRDFAWGTAQAKPAVLRFSARVTAVSNLVIGAGVRQVAGTHSFVRNVTLTNAWQDFVIPVPGPTVGVWATDSTQGVLINFALMCGSTYLAPAENVWGAGSQLAAAGVGNFAAVAQTLVDIRNVGLYLDPLATGVPPRWQMPDEAEELRACQRYYEVVYGGNAAIFSGNVVAGTYYLGVPFKTAKRVSPAVTAAGGNQSSAFPAATGTMSGTTWGSREARAATATANASYFYSSYVYADARM